MKKRQEKLIMISVFFALALIGGGALFLTNHDYILLTVLILLVVFAAIFYRTIFIGHEKVVKQMLDRVSLSKGGKVLAFTDGRVADLKMIGQCLEAPGKVTGASIWKDSIKEAKNEVADARMADRVELVEAGMSNLPFANHEFDYVLLDTDLHHITPSIERGRALQEAIRVLKAKGTLVVIDSMLIDEYKLVLNNFGIRNLRVVETGFNGWIGGPWITRKLLIAKRS
ncbi:MAG: class I SAM-dependent methyltransferase [Limosilactobacillus sp.]|uniref:class I SAM-dependent methyltransferase n=1 Tax=Limosilactobacillus sp. TaxID=2773925 RepID=UPI002700EADA|nr:class I SAM-dependent methyltransferase [Limosilactobacillus sp.]